MQGQTQDTWRALCERAIVEKHPDKLLQIINEINRLLTKKENRLQAVLSEHRGR